MSSHKIDCSEELLIPGDPRWNKLYLEAIGMSEANKLPRVIYIGKNSGAAYKPTGDAVFINDNYEQYILHSEYEALQKRLENVSKFWEGSKQGKEIAALQQQVEALKSTLYFIGLDLEMLGLCTDDVKKALGGSEGIKAVEAAIEASKQ